MNAAASTNQLGGDVARPGHSQALRHLRPVDAARPGMPAFEFSASAVPAVALPFPECPLPD